ncbi:MAG TPA: phosphoadenylyl-sulfate reductase [Trueperaceae bacterium]|nr:phosphoadenylyl-sulfate reductase [Trueperaceae bacterium]
MQHNLSKLNRDLEGLSSLKILEWAYGEFTPKIVASSSFQTQSVALLHMISEVIPELPVIFLDTGYHFPETLAYRDQLTELLGLNVLNIKSQAGKDFLQASSELHRTNPDLCCQINKVKPLNDALRGYQALISGVRRDQTANRAQLDFVSYKDNRYKISPMLNWTQKMVWQYLHEHNLPEHPLLKEGYLSIGCAPCTRAVKLGEDPRAGRWANTSKTECGLHLDLKDND